MIGNSRSSDGAWEGSRPQEGSLAENLAEALGHECSGEHCDGASVCAVAMEMQPIGFGIVGEDFAVAAPVQRGLDLLLGIFLGEMLVEKIVEELQRHGTVRFAFERLAHLLKKSHVGQSGVAKQVLLRLDVGLGKKLSLPE